MLKEKPYIGVVQCVLKMPLSKCAIDTDLRNTGPDTNCTKILNWWL